MTAFRIPLCLLVLLPAGLAAAQDWPAWRGPQGNGIAPDQPVPVTWDADTHIRWRIPLARPGNGSPIVSRGRVFLTMAEDEEGRQRSLYCFDRTDGSLRWVRTVEHGEAMPTHPTNPHGSTTPAADGERVVVWHASAGLHCYDFDGELLWQRDLGEFRHQWGHGTSPILYEDLVILQTGPGQRPLLAAFDRMTGDTVWEVEEPDRRTPEQVAQKRLAGSWCTPLIHRVGERDLVLCAWPTRVVAYDAQDGTAVWWCEGLSSDRGDLVYSSPVVAGDLCVIQGGYVGPTLAVRMDGTGDVTATHRTWHQPDVMSNCASGVFLDGRVYLPDMDGNLACLDPVTGTFLWRKRVGRGATWGSLVHADGRLYLMNQKGTTVVFQPGPDGPVILAENELGEATNATPAVSDGELFLRTHEHLYCVSAEGRPAPPP